MRLRLVSDGTNYAIVDIENGGFLRDVVGVSFSDGLDSGGLLKVTVRHPIAYGPNDTLEDSEAGGEPGDLSPMASAQKEARRIGTL